MNKIENEIDSEVKNEILKFNPEMNDALRIQIYKQSCSSVPSRDKKLTDFIDSYVEFKVSLFIKLLYRS